MFVKLCKGCPREEICQERICNSSWQREWLCNWDNIRRSGAKEKAACVVRRGQPEQDKPISHREYVFSHILTAGWRDVKNVTGN